MLGQNRIHFLKACMHSPGDPNPIFFASHPHLQSYSICGCHWSAAERARWYDKRDINYIRHRERMKYHARFFFSLNTSAACALNGVGAGNCTAVLITSTCCIYVQTHCYMTLAALAQRARRQSASRTNSTHTTPYRANFIPPGAKSFKLVKLFHTDFPDQFDRQK